MVIHPVLNEKTLTQIQLSDLSFCIFVALIFTFCRTSQVSKKLVITGKWLHPYGKKNNNTIIFTDLMWHVRYVFKFLNKRVASLKVSFICKSLFFSVWFDVRNWVHRSNKPQFWILLSISCKIHLHRNKGNHKTREPRARNYLHVYNVDMKKHYNYTLYVREVIL